MTTKDEAMKLALEALEANRRTHYYCEDTWYSCPKHEDGCANEAEGDDCNCGADSANAEIEKAITAIREALNAPLAEQPAHPVVPDAIHHTDLSESLEYIQGWNDCRAAMLEGKENT